MLLLQAEKLKMARPVREPVIEPYLRNTVAARVHAWCESAAVRFVAALHETRRRQAANTLHQYRHLIETVKPEHHDDRGTPS